MNQRAPFESPLEPFESPKELLNGAKEHLAELESMCNAISETRDYKFITNTDPKTREKVVKLQLKRKFPPKIRRLASNIVKELRTTLDQSFCEAAIILGRKNAKGTYFPFARDPKNLELVVKGKCFNDVDPRLIDYCLLFKPHHGGDSDGILWSMSNELIRAEQHGVFFSTLHEAYAVVLEKLDEIWEITRQKRKDRGSIALRHEFVQLAAMAIKAIHSMDNFVECEPRRNARKQSAGNIGLDHD